MINYLEEAVTISICYSSEKEEFKSIKKRFVRKSIKKILQDA